MASYLARAALGAIAGYIAVPLFGSGKVLVETSISGNAPAYSPAIDIFQPNTLITSVTAQESSTVSAAAAAETVTVTNYVLAPDLTKSLAETIVAGSRKDRLMNLTLAATLLLCGFLGCILWPLYNMQVRAVKERKPSPEASKKKLTDPEKDPKTTLNAPADAPDDGPINASAPEAIQAAYRVEIQQLKGELEAHIKTLEKNIDSNRNGHGFDTRPYRPEFPPTHMNICGTSPPEHANHF